MLPFGVRSQHESGTVEPGTDPGAPVTRARLDEAVWTTVVASVVFAICAVVYLPAGHPRRPLDLLGLCR